MMPKERTMEAVSRKLSFAEAEELEIEQYANSSWKDNAIQVLDLVKRVYALIGDGYPSKMEPIFRKVSLKDME